MRLVLSPSPLRRLLQPMTPGKEFMGGWRLSIETEEDADARVRFDHASGLSVGLHLRPRGDGGPCYAETATTTLAIVGEGRPAAQTDKFLKVLVALIQRNEASFVRNPWAGRPVPLERDEDRRQTDILVSTACDNHCVFCIDRPSVLVYRHSREIRDDIERLARDGYRAVNFVSLEPTLRNDLHDLVAQCRRSGFTRIGIVTNGTRTADREYLNRLVDAGLNHLTLSLHAADPETEAAITGNPDSFEKKILTLTHSAALRESPDSSGRALELTINTVINRYNLASLPDVVRTADRFRVDQLTLYLVMPQGQAWLHFDEVVPTLDEVRRCLIDVQTAAGAADVPVLLTDVPLCVAPDRLGGFRHTRRTHASFEQPIGEGALTPLTSDWDTERVKGPACATCGMVAACGGIWKEYARRRGFNELIPIPDDTIPPEGDEHR